MSVPGRQTVLVVDDDAISRELLGFLLESEGFAVRVCESGAEALGVLNGALADAPDVVLADLRMPGVSGAELAVALRAALPAGTVLVGMSASQPGRDLAALFDAFLLKPLTFESLRSALSCARHCIAAADAGEDGLRILAVADERLADNAAATVVLDDAAHAKLAALMQPVQLRELYQICVADVRERVDRMRVLAEHGDAAAFRKEAHAIKGGSSMLGAREISSLASAMEIGSGEPWSSARALAQTEKLTLACNRLESILVSRTQQP
ncbi:MAG: response regulator [Acidobacteriaceae bacterium]